MADLSDYAEMWCRLFGYLSCYQPSILEIIMLIGAACLMAVFVVVLLFGVFVRLAG